MKTWAESNTLRKFTEKETTTIIPGLVKGEDYIDFGFLRGTDQGRVRLYQPLTHKAAMVLASNDVLPIVGQYGADWAISATNTDRFWKMYTTKGLKFLFVFTKKTKYALVVYPSHITSHDNPEVYDIDDEQVDMPYWMEEKGNIYKVIDQLKDPVSETLEDLLTKYRGTLVQNSDGTVDKVGDKEVELDSFIKDGHFICQFGRWEGNFDVSSNYKLTSLIGSPKEVVGDFDCRSVCGLKSLEGAPHIVDGDFNCSLNYSISFKGVPTSIGGSFKCYRCGLTTLKDTPKIVGCSFDCSNNKIVSLEGAPEYVPGNFDCHYNSIDTLVGAPKMVGGDFDCTITNITSLEGLPERIDGRLCIRSDLKDEAKAKGYNVD